MPVDPDDPRVCFPVPQGPTVFWHEQDWRRYIAHSGWIPQEPKSFDLFGFLWVATDEFNDQGHRLYRRQEKSP